MVRWEPNPRGRLQEAALALYGERGFENTTVAEIAERAGLTERTFFRHFADKRELLAAVSAVGFEQLTKRMSDKIAGLSNGNSAPARTSTPLAGAFCCGTSRLVDSSFLLV